MMRLVDDGTLDTVLECSACGEWERYNFLESWQPCSGHDSLDSDCGNNECYDEFVTWAIADAEDAHECYKTALDWFDYTNQAWVMNGRYIRCGHPESMACNCYGKLHEGEEAFVESEEEYVPASTASYRYDHGY